MSVTGIVRKIDELGRIVIPKEIRKTLNIRNGDDIEIKVEENKILLQKYYRLKNISESIKDYYEILENKLSTDFIITDTEKIILLSKNLQSKINNLNISSTLLDLIKSRKQKLENNEKSIKINNDVFFQKYYYFCPIVIDADILGSVILLSDNKIIDSDINIVDIVFRLLKLKIM